MRYTLKIDPPVQERYPDYSVLVLYARELVNGPSNAESRMVLRSAEAGCRASLSSETLTQHLHIAAWREAYRSFAAKPKKYPCSVEALLARTLKGQDLPEINCIVDIYNAVSIKHVLPVGGEDWNRLESDLYLKFSQGNEAFETSQAGQTIVTYPDQGEVIWADQAGVTCRRWNWRQSPRTMLTVESEAAYFVLDRLAPYSKEALHAAGEDLERLLKQFSPACTVTWTWLGE